MNRVKLWRLVLTLSCVGLMVNCAPPVDGTPTRAGVEGGVTAPPAAPKTLRIAMGREPKPGFALMDQQGGTGADLHTLAFHSGLTWHDSEGKIQPLLASKVPSISDGDWKLLPDGQMEVTWKIRPDVKWHDGRPFTTEDLVLGMRVVRDPELDGAIPAWMRFESGVSAPDPQTFVVTWSEPYMLANRALPREVPAVASHIIGSLYDEAVRTGNKQPFINSPYWSPEWVGLGPYRLVERVEGAHLEGVANDDYFLGRPKIDRIYIRFYPEVNSLILAVMSGEADFVPAGSFSTAHIHTLKQEWEPTGAGTATLYPSGMAANYFQFGDPDAPWAKDLRVRRAIVHMYDRQTYVDVLEFGLTQVADTLVGPRDPVYKIIEERGLSRYPYDQAQAARLLGEAGWTRGPDGVYRNPTGATFDIEVITKLVTDESFRRTETSASMLKAAGLNATARSYPSATAGLDDRRVRSTFKGLFASINIVDEPQAGEAFLTSGIRVDPNGISIGTNIYRYSNPEYDRLFDRYITTLDESSRQGLRADVLRFIADQVPVVPLYYSFVVLSQTIRNNVRGPGYLHPTQSASGWGIHTWEMD